MADDEAVLTANIVSLASEYGRYGYRRITALLTADGWRVNHKRVERIWRREGLKVPARHPKRGRLWLNDGSCLRLRPAYGNHVWAYDFVFERTREGRPLKFLTVVDEFTRQCLAIEVGSRDVVHRAGKSVGERLHRKLQRKTQGRTPQRGDFHDAEGGTGVDGALASGIQSGPPTQFTRL